MTCAVVIPTFNNHAILPATLAALFAQAVPADCNVQVVVSDDGSTDGTLAWLRHQTPPPPWRLAIVVGPHTGPGGARNRALAASRSDVILFLGADILLRPGALHAHLDFHVAHPTGTDAALGMVKWDPRLFPPPLLEWMTHSGQQNAFDDLLGQRTADPRHYFYGSHLSLKRAILPDPAFTGLLAGGWEDLELGQRLADHSLALHVLHHAIGLHHHPYSQAAIARRQRLAGTSLPRYQSLHPGTSLIPQRSLMSHLCRWVFCVLGGQGMLSILVRRLKRRSLPRAFTVFTSNELWKGLWASSGGFLAFLRQLRTFSSHVP